MKKGDKNGKDELEILAAMKDEEIDTTDIPEIIRSSSAVVGKFYRPIKQSITVRLDADVIAWLRSGGRGYQTRANKILRSAMEKQHETKKAG
jgi:uncharacterized protein (DUF4415 family)